MGINVRLIRSGFIGPNLYDVGFMFRNVARGWADIIVNRRKMGVLVSDEPQTLVPVGSAVGHLLGQTQNVLHKRHKGR